MKSPLDIDKTVKRYGLDDELKKKLILFDDFIWQEFSVKDVEQVVGFEKEYRKLSDSLGFVYDGDFGDVESVEMMNGTMDLLLKGRFQQLSKIDTLGSRFLDAGLNELETLVIKTFYADLSGLYRLDAYHSGVPPFII